MNKLLNIVRLSFSTVIRNIGSLIILIILMTFCVISFNRIIGYIRYQNQISSTFFKSNLDNAIAYSNLEISPISQTFVENKDLLDEKQIIENMEGVKGVGDRYLLFCELLMEESKWFEYTAPDGTTMVEKYHRELIEIYDDIYAESCYIPLSSGCQLSDVRNLPSDVNPIIVSSNVLEYFPYGEVREINLRGFSSSKNSEETEAPWSGKVKVQTVGVIKENAPILGMSHSASGYNAMTLSYIVEFIRDNREIVIMKTPEKYKNEIMRFGMVPNSARLVQVESGEDLSTIAKQLLKLGGIVGVTPI